MEYDYEINQRPAELGGGWQLRLLEDGQEVGGGVFSPEGTATQGVTWWNGISEKERGHWLSRAVSAVPAEAWLSYTDAEAAADEWLDSKER